MINSSADGDVRRLLDELEEHLDPQQQRQIRHRHMQAATWQVVDRPPVLIVRPWDQPTEGLYSVSEAVRDPAKMLINELRKGFGAVNDWLRIRDDRPLQISPDFGIGLVASAFAAHVQVVGNNPPWVHPLAKDNISTHRKEALDKFDVARAHELGWLPRVSETLDYYKMVLVINTAPLFEATFCCVATRIL